MSTKTITPRKTSLFVEDGTIYSFDFDFTSAVQQEILDELQAKGYSLFGYKGATGPGQLTVGVPTWFVIPFLDVFGNVDIEYEPQYKVYVYNSTAIGPYTKIIMQALSDVILLGTAIQFDSDGSFSVIGDAPAGTISVFNNRPGSTPDVTIGLAALVNNEYRPFCAFNCTPQGSVGMQPNENVVLFAGISDLQSGSVIGHAAAPGCTFQFNSKAVDYDLQVVENTYEITSAPDGLPVRKTLSNANLMKLLNR